MEECIYIVNKIESLDHHIGLVEALKLTSLHVELEGDQKYSNLSMNEQLTKMYVDLKKFVKRFNSIE